MCGGPSRRKIHRANVDQIEEGTLVHKRRLELRKHPENSNAYRVGLGQKCTLSTSDTTEHF